MINFLSSPKTQKLCNKTPIICDASNEFHVKIFRLLLELAIYETRWNGKVAQVS
jgi:hypothetical protein